MTKTGDAFYQALVSRDRRFDGVFFAGVTSTGIYCRPVCTVKTPKQANCRFFSSAEAAEKAGFRPCLRCRPELAPGNAPVDDGHRIACLIANRIEEGSIDESAGLEDIAGQFQLSSRQIRRIIRKEMGVSPIELMQTRRLLLAKQLLTDTSLSMTEVAFASGFSSIRRFNETFNTRYRMPPGRLRKETPHHKAAIEARDTSTVLLSYRPPYNWDGVLAFLTARMLKGAEWITKEAYCRTVRLGKHKGWVRVTHKPEKCSLAVEFSHSLTPALPALLGRLRNLFDLGARPDLITRQLGKDGLLKKIVGRNPGLRVPGCFDGFELAFRAILGQQITVKAATTIACRFVEFYGDKIITPFPELNRLAPLARQIAKSSVGTVAKRGVTGARARSLIALAKACEKDGLTLEAGANPETGIRQLTELPGVGLWTAHYIAMRALRWPDAFPKEDIAIRNNLGGVTPKEAEAMSQTWRPWRSYAVLHIWAKGKS